MVPGIGNLLPVALQKFFQRGGVWRDQGDSMTKCLLQNEAVGGFEVDQIDGAVCDSRNGPDELEAFFRG